jgi:hypothetical protein
MLFPKSRPLYEDLSTSFTQLEALLVELRANQFTGCALVAGWEYKGHLFFDTGRMINAREDTKERSRQGSAASAGIMLAANEKNNSISVYRLADEVVQVLASLLTDEPIYKDLSIELTGLDKLVLKLQGEKFTGAIDVRMKKTQVEGTILLRDGEILECVLSKEGSVTSGQILDQIVQAARDDAVFTVYRAEPARVYSSGVDRAESFSRPAMLAQWQAVLRIMESTIDHVNKASEFNPALRRACIALASDYPFLDPFAGEFDYHEGHLVFNGQATVAQLNAGLSQCLLHTVGDLIARSPQRDLVNQLHAAVKAGKDLSRIQLEQMGLVQVLPTIFLTESKE